MGSEQQRPDKIFEDFTRNSPAAARFGNARIVDRSACTVKAFTSLAVPWRGNVLAIGDAAAYVEVEVQGALMCGYHAARAVVDELQQKSGFDAYTQWWQQSFEFNSPEALRVAQGYALVPTYTDDEIDPKSVLRRGQGGNAVRLDRINPGRSVTINIRIKFPG